MQEDFLHYIWKFQYFNHSELFTSDGKSVLVQKQGNYQHNSGPDFENCQVRIDGIEWNGSVEIHIRSSEWYLHKHNQDEAYNNVILHVVWTNDRNTLNKNGEAVPTLELRNRIDTDLISKFKKFISSDSLLACSSHRSKISDLKLYEMIDKSVGERLLQKAEVVKELYQKTESWEETSYLTIAKNFGFKVNSDPFLQLATATPIKFLKKHSDQLLQLEALLFGQAGFLEEDCNDGYYMKLKLEYEFLAHKYQIHDSRMTRFQWKFLRLRPANFPTLRIAQFANFIYQNTHLFNVLVEQDSIKELIKKLMTMHSEYWLEHFDFGKPFSGVSKGLGKSSAENILINTVAPILACYGKQSANQSYLDRAIDLLEDLRPENNKITRIWKESGFPVKSAFDSQGLIMQYNESCKNRKCLQCSIGADLLNRSL